MANWMDGFHNPIFRFPCLDCHRNTYDLGEYYRIHDSLWNQLVPEGSGFLCIECLEKRLGQRLQPSDFDHTKNDYKTPWDSELLKSRRGY